MGLGGAVDAQSLPRPAAQSAAAAPREVSSRTGEERPSYQTHAEGQDVKSVARQLSSPAGVAAMVASLLGIVGAVLYESLFESQPLTAILLAVGVIVTIVSTFWVLARLNKRAAASRKWVFFVGTRLLTLDAGGRPRIGEASDRSKAQGFDSSTSAAISPDGSWMATLRGGHLRLYAIPRSLDTAGAFLSEWTAHQLDPIVGRDAHVIAVARKGGEGIWCGLSGGGVTYLLELRKNTPPREVDRSPHGAATSGGFHGHTFYFRTENGDVRALPAHAHVPEPLQSETVTAIDIAMTTDGRVWVAVGLGGARLSVQLSLLGQASGEPEVDARIDFEPDRVAIYRSSPYPRVEATGAHGRKRFDSGQEK